MEASTESKPNLGRPENSKSNDVSHEADDDSGEIEDVEVEDIDTDYLPEEPPKPATPEARIRQDRADGESLLRRISTERVPIRVHDILIKGNTKTKDSIIEAEVEELLKNATTIQQLLQAAGIANARLQGLDIFDAVNITLDAGPPELPGTANVVIEVSEAKSTLTGDVGFYSKPETKSWSFEGSLKLKNLFGYGDLWDGSAAYGLSQGSEVSAGVAFPKFKALPTPLTARVSLLTQDWMKLSSYKEQALGLSLCLFSNRKHNLSYNLSWRTLTDPSQMASYSVRRQLGHYLHSALKYTYKVDHRNSPLRPTRGYAFLSTTEIGGLVPDGRSLRFIRQEFDLRYAVPLGFARAALNFGISAGAVFPWGRGSLNRPSYLPERLFLGSNSSPVCTLRGITSILGFSARGLGPSEPRRQDRENSDTNGVDFTGGDLAVAAFADLSFDLPLKFLRESGIHGHIFGCAGSLNKLTENAYRDLSFQKFRESFRYSAGIGVILPTNLFRMEANLCYIKKHEQDQAGLFCPSSSGKFGVQFNFSAPL